MADVFISYSRRDKEFVARLTDALVARGKDPWVDWEDIPASADWFREIQTGIDSTDAFLYVLSPDSATSEVCARELDHALSRNKRVLPILRRMVEPAQLRPEAAALNWVYLRDEDDFDEAMHTLVKAIDTDLDHVRAHTRWSQAATEWKASERNHALLARGAELEEAERWLTAAAGKEPAPTELQSEFVQESRDAARRRQRVLFASVTVALAVAVVLSIVALIQRSNAVEQSRIAFARELDAQAQNQYDSDPELSVLLARRAAEEAPGQATTEALRQALARSHVRQTLRYEKPPGAARWLPDGKHLVVARSGGADIVEVGGAGPIRVEQPGLSGQVAVSGKGDRLALGGSSVRVVEPATGKTLVETGDTGGLQVALSGDGKRVFWVDIDGAVRSADAETGGDTRTYDAFGDKFTTAFGVSAGGDVLAAASTPDVSREDAPRRLRAWDARTGEVLFTRQLAAQVGNLDFSPDGRRLAIAMSGGREFGVLVFDTRTGDVEHRFREGATDVAFSQDGGRLAYCASGLEIGHVYDFSKGSEQLLIGHEATIQMIEFSPSGRYVVTTSFDETARVWDAFTGTQEQLLAGHEAAVFEAFFNEDETRLATASTDGTARVWATPLPVPDRTLKAAGTRIEGLGYARDGSRVLVNERSLARILDGRTLEGRRELRPPAGKLFAGIAFSPKGDLIAGLDGEVDAKGDFVSTDSLHVYDAGSGRRLATLATPGSPVVNAAWAGELARVATMSEDGRVLEWDARTGKRRWEVELDAPPQGVSYDESGSLLAVTHASGLEDRPLTVDLIRDGKVIRTIEGPPQLSQIRSQGFFVFLGVAFSPDGKEIAITGANSFVARYSVATGRQIGRAPTKDSWSVSATYSHDGRLLAAGNPNSIQLFELPSGDRLREFQHVSTGLFRFNAGTAGRVTAAFSDDDQVMLTTGDVRVRAWRTSTGESLFDVGLAHGTFTPDGRRIVAADPDEIRMYRCELCADREGLLQVANRFATRGFTPTERSVYLHED